MTKDSMTATIVLAAVKLGLPKESPDKSARVSGHSLRVSGAQGLARAGVETWAIQLLGRWGSATVLQYVREVPLEHSAAWAGRAARAHALEELLRSRTPLAPAVVPEPAPASSSITSPLPSGSVARAALADALLEASEAERVSAEPVSECLFVTSDAGKWHRLARAGLTSACGWRFAGSPASLSAKLPERLCHKDLCGHCFGELRDRLKRET